MTVAERIRLNRVKEELQEIDKKIHLRNESMCQRPNYKSNPEHWASLQIETIIADIHSAIHQPENCHCEECKE